MSAAVAHEIRNPLAAIVQANALLEEDLHDPGQKRLAHMVQQNADRLARIAEEVLDIARVQHQISHVPGRYLALDASVAQVVERLAAAKTRRGGAARLSLETSMVQVEFDPEHLRRVLVEPAGQCPALHGPRGRLAGGADAHQPRWADHTAGVERRRPPWTNPSSAICLSPSSPPRAAPAAWGSISAASCAKGMAHPSATSAPHATPRVEKSVATHSPSRFAAPHAPWNLPRFSTRS